MIRLSPGKRSAVRPCDCRDRPHPDVMPRRCTDGPSMRGHRAMRSIQPAQSRTVILPIVIAAIILFTTAAASYGETASFPYKLDLATDLTLASAGFAASGISVVLYTEKRTPGMWEVLSARKSELNTLDRSAVGRKLYGAAPASSVLAAVSAAAPVFLAIPCAGRAGTTGVLTFFAMYAEVVVLNLGVNGIFKGAVNRKRPYLYYANILERKPRDRDSAMSFYSLHTSIAFSSLSFLAVVYGDLYRSPGLSALVWTAALSTAAVTGGLRYASGNHFPTDIITGAAMGILTGSFIPVIHKTREQEISVAPVSSCGWGLAVVLKF